MKEVLEEEVKKYRYTPEYQVEVAGLKIDVPVKYADASAFMVLFPISMEKAKNLLKSSRLTPVSILKGRAVLAITFFDYRESPVGPYHEFTFSIPVVVDSKINIPILPLIFDSLFPSFGYHVVLMGADSGISREHIEKLFPYPTFDKNLMIDLHVDGSELSAIIKDGGEEIILVRQVLPIAYKLGKKGYNTYYTRGGFIFKVRLQTFSYSAKIRKVNNFQVKLGSHQISSLLREMCINIDEPVTSIFYKKAVEIASGPQAM